MTLDDLYQELHQKAGKGELEVDQALADGLYTDLIATFAVEKMAVTDCRIIRNRSELTVEGKLCRLDGICRIKNEYQAQFVLCMTQTESGKITYRAVMSLKCDIPLEELIGETAPFVSVDRIVEESLFTGVRLIEPVLEYVAAGGEILIRGFASLDDLPEKWLPYRFLLDKRMPVEGKLQPARFSYPHLTMTFQGQKAITLPIGAGSGMLVIDTLDDPERFDNWSATQAYMLWEIKVTGLEKQISFWTKLFSGREEWQFSAFFAPVLSVGDVTRVLKDVLQLPDRGMLLPEGAFLSSFGLQQLDLVCGCMGEQLQNGLEMKHVRAIFSLDRPLEVLVPKLILEDFQASWEASRWGGGEFAVTLFLAATASVSIGSLLLEGSMTAYVPYMQFEGSLSLKNQENFQTVAEACGAELPDFWKTDAQENKIYNEIARIDAAVDGIGRTIGLKLVVEDVLPLRISSSLAFELEEVRADIFYGSGDMDFGISGTLAFRYQENGEAEEGFAFALSAKYVQEDWRFTGSLAYGQVDMVKLVKCFLGMPVEDTQALHVVLQDFSASYSTKEKELILYASCEVWFTILGSKTALGGRLRFRQKEDVKEAALAAYLEIGIFTVLAQVDDIYRKDKKYLFRMEFGGKYVQAVYHKDTAGDEILSFSLGGMTVGDLVLALIRLINPNAKQALASPWNVLNKIPLSDFIFVFNVTRKTASFLYHVNRNIAGVMEVDDIGIAYDGESIRYIVTGRCLNRQYTLEDPFSWDAQNGSPEENIAANEQKFHLYYFAVGNHLDIDIEGSKLDEILDNVKKAMKPESGVPEFSYREHAGWLVASEFELCDILHVRLLMYDPEIYGATIEVKADEKSSLAFLNGLFLELYYKRISDTTGMFHCRLTLPAKYSQLDFGAVKLYLGELLLEIYTNGSFYLDLGFPHNRDFSASWGITMGTFGGKGGVYLGTFHGDAVNSVPAVTNGAFSPVVKLGIGLSVGLSQSFDIGIAKGGVSLTAVGMFEGIFALFHPLDETEPESHYYKVSAVVGVVGTLFLSIDFKIIAVFANAQISAFCNLEMESCRKSQLTVDLELRVSASIKILFVEISFAFHFQHTANFTFGSDQDTPWILQETDSRMLQNGTFPKVMLNVTSVSDKIRISPVIVPLCSLADQDGKQENTYCMAFLAFLSQEDFKSVLALLLKLLCADAGRMVACRFSEALRTQKISGSVNYGFVLELFSRHIEVHISISSGEERAEDAEDMTGTVFPMLPQLSLVINDMEIDYGSRVVDEQYMRELSAYFEKLNADTAYALPENADMDEEIPICGAVLTDWIKMIVEELTGRIEGIFRAFSKSCEDLSAITNTYGVSAEFLLKDNPKMSLRVSALPKTVVSICQGDTLKKLSETYALDAASLWDCVAKTAGLPGEALQIDMEGYVFDNSVVKLTRKEAAAIFYVRFYQTEALYSPYAEFILEQNSDLDMEWKCARAGETVINLPQGMSRKELAGDSVVRIAKECAILDGLCGEESWNRFYKVFLERNPEEQADKYQLFGTYTLPDCATLAEMYCCCFPDFDDDPEDYPLWSSQILRPLAVIQLYDIPINKTDTAENLVKEYGADAIVLALQEKTANLSGEQELVLSGALSVPESELEEMVLTEKTVLEISAIISRVFLQGARLSDPQMHVQKPLYEVLRQQIPLPDVLDHMHVRLRAHPSDTWLYVPDQEVLLTADRIKSWLPEEQAQTVGMIQDIAPFSEQTQCWTMTEGWKILNIESTSYVGILPQPVSAYLEKYDEALRLEKEGKVFTDIQWAAMLTLRLCRKSKGVYALLGVKADEQDFVLSLITEKNFTCGLYYLPSRFESEQEGLMPVDCAGCTLIKADLSKETYHLADLAGAEEREYIANIENPISFMKLLWECSVIGGGYWFSCPMDRISEDVFDEEGRGEILLAVTFQEFPTKGRAVNAVFMPVEPVGTALYGEKEQVRIPQLPAGCAGFCAEREFSVDDRFQSLFQLLGYEAEEQSGEHKIYESAPILPVERERGAGEMTYRFIFPMWKLYGDNPYAGVGETCKLSLFLHDVLGNRRFYADYSVTGAYNDLLIGIHELPFTKLTYGFVAEKGSRYVKIICRADPEAENGNVCKNPDILEADKARLRMAYWQYSCKDIALSARFSLCKKTLELPEDVPDRLTVYMDVLYRRLCGEVVAVPEVEICCDVGEKDAQETICPITLYIKAVRGDVARDDVAAVSVETKAMPMEEENGEYFEKGFEAVFVDDQIAYDNQNQPYAVSRSLFQNLRVTPFHLDAGGRKIVSPEFYALVPFSRSLLTKEVVVGNDYGEQEIYTFVNIDANQWEKQFLGDVETFLSDQLVCKASRVCPENVNRLVKVKREMAELLTARLRPIRAGASSFVPEEVRGIVRERFLKDLNLAYETGVVASYQAVWENDTLYRLEPETGEDACLSASKLSTTCGEEGKSVFCMFFKEAAISSSEIKVSFPYLEYNIGSGIEGYERSDWLRLRTSVTEGITLESELAFPFPKKECPVPVQLLEQSNGTDQEAFMRYRWACTLSAKVYMQDTLYLILEYENICKGASPEENQIDILARYQLERETIMNMLEAEDTVADAYRKFVSYAESYVSREQRFCQDIRGTIAADGSIKMELGFSVSETEATIHVRNAEEVAAKMKELGASLVLPEQVGRNTEDGTIQLEVEITGLPIYGCNWMKPQAYMVRNENLFGDSCVTVNKEFMFCTEPVELDRLRITVDYKDVFVIDEAGLAEAVQRAWEILEIDQYPLRLNMTLFYEYPVVGKETDLFARIPVTFMTNVSDPESITKNVEDWKEKYMPCMSGGKLMMDVFIYANDSDSVLMHACLSLVNVW